MCQVYLTSFYEDYHQSTFGRSLLDLTQYIIPLQRDAEACHHLEMLKNLPLKKARQPLAVLMDIEPTMMASLPTTALALPPSATAPSVSTTTTTTASTLPSTITLQPMISAMVTTPMLQVVVVLYKSAVNK
uniref:Uncharacterized protein n=1 Tax=Romanomermis culicivorax TaxID=13658 RepID=A0A915KRZ3_ROMCU